MQELANGTSLTIVRVLPTSTATCPISARRQGLCSHPKEPRGKKTPKVEILVPRRESPAITWDESRSWGSEGKRKLGGKIVYDFEPWMHHSFLYLFDYFIFRIV